MLYQMLNDCDDDCESCSYSDVSESSSVKVNKLSCVNRGN